MCRKFYSEMKNGGYLLVYLMENYYDDIQQILEIREKIRKDFPKVKDNQIAVMKMCSKESNINSGCISLRFQVNEVAESILDEFVKCFTKLTELNYSIINHTAPIIKRYWSKIEGMDGYIVRYAIKEGHRDDIEYLMTLMEAIKADYPEIEISKIYVNKLEYWYSEVLADVTVLEFRTSRVNFLEVEKFPLNEEPDC